MDEITRIGEAECEARSDPGVRREDKMTHGNGAFGESGALSGEYRTDGAQSGGYRTDGALCATERSRAIRTAYLAAALAVTVGAALASRRLFAPGTLFDPFADCTAWAQWALAAGRLVFPTLCAFFAVYAASFSPLAIPVSLGALAVCGAASGVSFFALVDGARSAFAAPACVAAAPYALSSLMLPVFAARACELSPAARSLRFSSFDGRREAASLTLSFFTLSGAAALLCTASALILRFGR